MLFVVIFATLWAMFGAGEHLAKLLLSARFQALGQRESELYTQQTTANAR
jgi:hypothetical protein